MGDCPSSGLSLERLDNNLGYCKSNVVWGTIEQQANNKRSSKRFTYQGEPKTIQQLSDIAGINYGNMQHRLCKAGYTVEQAVNLPLGVRPK